MANARYLNRELSWLNFNRRVLDEALNPTNPLLERLRFLAIFEANLDEFYMVRVSGLIEQHEARVMTPSPDGQTPSEQLLLIAEAAEPLRSRAGVVLREQVLPELAQHGVVIKSYASLNDRQRRDLNHRFAAEIFPLCTPLLLNSVTNPPFISNRSLNLVIELRSEGETKLARLKIPTVIPRMLRLGKRKTEFVPLEEVIVANLQALFPGVEIVGAHLFRVIRDADVEIRELEAADLIATIEETLRLRRFGDPVLLQTHPTMPPHVRQFLMSLLRLDDEDVFAIEGMLGMESLHEIVALERPSLHYGPYLPHVAENLSTAAGIFDAAKKEDILFHHPYDGFRPVEEFISSAVKDPDVIGIKQTLYRVGQESPLVESLMEAAERGKQVAAMVELKARFDESNNLVWARALERAGAHVTYGFAEMKTHCKLCLIVRREGGVVRSYAHIGTGNYNPATSRIYTDLGLITCDEDITQDISELFNYLTGFSRQTKYRKLLVAPVNLREGILARIRREAKTKGGRIVLKLNALVDPEVIEALYEANNAGVKIDLIVRGICCLRPGVPGMSENIRVVSIVGRYLEHSRVYYFANGGQPDVLIGSADAMRRNLDRRIEALVPVENPKLIELIYERILKTCLKDTTKAWELVADGSYKRRVPVSGEPPFDAQAWFMGHPLTKEQFRTSR